MRTKQHNLNPVERTIGASGLLGQIGRQDLSQRVYPVTGFGSQADTTQPCQPDDRCAWLVMGLDAGSPGSFGLSAERPGHIQLS